MKEFVVLDAMFLIFIEETQEPREFFRFFYKEKDVEAVVIPRSVLREVKDQTMPYHKAAVIKEINRNMSFQNNRLSRQDKDVIEIARLKLGDSKVVVSDDNELRKELDELNIEKRWVSEILVEMLESGCISSEKYKKYLEAGFKSLKWSEEVQSDLREKS